MKVRKATRMRAESGLRESSRAPGAPGWRPARDSDPLAYSCDSDLDAVRWLAVVGARQNNLKNIAVEIPLGRFVCVTGVSGSGKSSLVNDILREALARDLNGATNVRPGAFDRIEGIEHLDKVIDIDQSPIGRTPRSNPATYIKVFDEVRDLFARLPDAKVRGYKPGRFSFNVATGPKGGGRCEACEGNGSNKMEMELLADVWVTCPVCEGRRFSRETLQILYKGKSVTDVLGMDVQQALDHFDNVPAIAAMLRTLHDVGLDYIKLGQSSTTLSGGEAQRIKLARELVKKSTGRTLYILDEPTTGLHFADIKRLLSVLHGFVDGGNTVLVVEHNLDVVKTADWVIDLGPEGGDAGGEIVATGTPEEVAECAKSYTGVALREVLVETSKSPNVQKSKPGVGRATAADQHSDRKKAVNPQSPNHQIAQSPNRQITVVGAKQHNLKDISVDFPRDKITVCCGPSGSGKTSFAVDTVYAEGQRRYVESLSSYARQFLGRLQPPRVDHIDGLSPAICIEQKNTTRSPRSTVGTITEIYDYMRVLWAKIGKPYCPKCKVPIGAQTADEIVERILSLGEGTRLLLIAPVEPAANETYQQFFDRERANGYIRARMDGRLRPLDEPIDIDARQRHCVELVIDRVVVRRAQRSRLTDSVEQALAVGRGVAIAQRAADESSRNGDLRFSRHHACERCGRSYEELTPHHFSFNTRMGWCETCQGLGVQQGANPAAIVVHPTRSIADGAIAGWEQFEAGSLLGRMVAALADHVGLALHTPWNQLTEPQRRAILHGSGEDWIPLSSEHTESDARSPNHQISRSLNHQSGIRFQWRGFFPAIARAARSSAHFRQKLADHAGEAPCETCAGSRLRPDAAAVRVNDATLHETCARPLARTLEWFESFKPDVRQRKIAGELLHEITSRLRFLVDVGLDYLTLHRPAATLSGGEAQRIQLASQIGTGLTGVLYVLDEPTIGLHPRDNNRLLAALKRLRNLGNTLLLVEHDREIIDSADHVLDFGPGAGAFGGTVTAAASPARLRAHRASLTGKYLSGREAIAVPSNRRPVNDLTLRTDLEPEDDDTVSSDRAGFNAVRTFKRRGGGTANRQSAMANRQSRWLVVYGARENSLKEIDVAFPLGRFTCVTGVSGSGKSTLVNSILHNALAVRIHRASLTVGAHDRISGVEHIDKVINVDQSPIGNSPSSNPATYTGVFDAIRELYARLALSKVRGYTANRFSFNRPGGRCEVCQGMGQRCIEMHFLPDVWIECENCNGMRYVPETLEVTYRDKSIANVLTMRVGEAVDLFGNVPRIRRILQTLADVGLGYLELGRSAPTLSGGEAQRVKLASELGRPSTGNTLYILDEPTTGLHFDDLRKLLEVLHRLVDLGNTVICIEHNLDVIKTADWVIDLGPEAGDAGGQIVVAGTPETVALTRESHTGLALKPMLEMGPIVERRVFDARAQAKLEAEAESPIDVGGDAKMPWEVNGRSWHTVDHVDGKGRAVEWDPAVLLWLVETIESLGGFA
ncbi:MAG: ATP-binding cassette domain-containing protein, partial [Phycisphaerales bacterium]|nr:ATP-binding cassette domain-containing protein [Phycisphaerales bacterium]